MRNWRSGARMLPAVTVAVLLSGCGNGAEDAGGGGGGFQFPPTAVEVAPVTVGPVANVFETIGTLEAGEAVTIVSEIDGIAVRLPFREGGTIEKGEPIAQLNDAELAANLARVKALRDQRQASHDRVLRVVELSAASQQDLDDAVAALRVAEADVALARARLRKTRITAPFSGSVGARQVSPGAFLRAGQPITELVQLSELKVRFSVPERYTGDLSRGAEVTVTTTAYPGYRLTGTIDVVDPMLNTATRSVQAIARVKNPDHRFRPGMSANVTAILSARASAMTIPSEAVYADGDQFLAYVMQPDSTVAPAQLQLGMRLATRVEILSGLEEGDWVVRAGHQKLFPGAKVFAVNSQRQTLETSADQEPVAGQDASADVEASAGQDAPAAQASTETGETTP